MDQGARQDFTPPNAVAEQVGVHERAFVNPAAASDLVEETLVHGQTAIAARVRDAPAAGFLLEIIHQTGDINPVGAARGAGFARGTDPDGAAVKRLIGLAQKQKTQDAIGRMIHGESERTAVGAFATLVADRCLDTAASFHLGQKVEVNLNRCR